MPLADVPFDPLITISRFLPLTTLLIEIVFQQRFSALISHAVTRPVQPLSDVRNGLSQHALVLISYSSFPSPLVLALNQKDSIYSIVRKKAFLVGAALW